MTLKHQNSHNNGSPTMQRFFTSFTLILITAFTLSLSGCNTGGLSGTGGGTITSAKYEYRFLPSTLTLDLPENLILKEGTSPSPSSILSIHQEGIFSAAKLKNLENQLDIMRIDAAFEQITTFCKDVAIEQLCIIPSGEIYFTFTQPMANTEHDIISSLWELEGRSQTTIDAGLADLDEYHAGIVGDLTPLEATKFTRLNGALYDYTVKQLKGSIYTPLNKRKKWSLSWTANKNDALLFSEKYDSRSDYTMNYSFYRKRTDGTSMVTRTTLEDQIGQTISNKMSIKERNDNEHGVYLRFSASNTYPTVSPIIYTLESVDNDIGGYAFTQLEYPNDGNGYKERETIDQTGARLDNEICSFTGSSSYCDDDNNWETKQGFTPRQDIKESAFFTIYNAIDNFSASLGQAGITVQNLPSSINSFVIAGEDFPEKKESLLCSGQRNAGEIILHCGVDADVIRQMNASVYEEVAENGTISYQPTAATVH